MISAVADKMGFAIEYWPLALPSIVIFRWNMQTNKQINKNKQTKNVP